MMLNQKRRSNWNPDMLVSAPLGKGKINLVKHKRRKSIGKKIYFQLKTKNTLQTMVSENYSLICITPFTSPKSAPKNYRLFKPKDHLPLKCIYLWSGMQLLQNCNSKQNTTALGHKCFIWRCIKGSWKCRMELSRLEYDHAATISISV